VLLALVERAALEGDLRSLPLFVVLAFFYFFSPHCPPLPVVVSIAF
jgi:hypothetical protein